jgi:hypothetical protein
VNNSKDPFDLAHLHLVDPDYLLVAPITTDPVEETKQTEGNKNQSNSPRQSPALNLIGLRLTFLLVIALAILSRIVAF